MATEASQDRDRIERPERQVMPLTRTRRIIAERMTLSATTVPQVTYTLRCDVTEALRPSAAA